MLRVIHLTVQVYPLIYAPSGLMTEQSCVLQVNTYGRCLTNTNSDALHLLHLHLHVITVWKTVYLTMHVRQVLETTVHI